VLLFSVFNARSLNNKLPDLHYPLRSQEFDVLCVTETWLHESVLNSIILDGSPYSLFRSDRQTGHGGGGVCIFTNNNTTKVICIPVASKFSSLQLCVVDYSGQFSSVCVVDLPRGTRLRLFVCYRPPSGDSDPVAVQYLCNMRDCLGGLFPANSSVIICGDFNLPNIDWSVDNCSKCNAATCSGIFLEFFYAHSLLQLVENPTKFDHTLDLVLCNDHNCVFNIEVRAPFNTSDHCLVCFQVQQKPSLDNHGFLPRDFGRADWIGIQALRNSVDFFKLFHSSEPASVIIEEFYRIVNTNIELYVPLKCHQLHKKSRPFTYPYRIRRLLC
jgi:exonuclease III